ncbi:unnamed protein product [Protopolystoma xenopodis]|uniref:Uncharacterized protein n=1 Tax=Protopolystoma xenopodis TaxID=117903 RepID=A0A448WN78_9PLAT|nr:unnamed protein product [Protopolystoma xenopodis]
MADAADTIDKLLTAGNQTRLLPTWDGDTLLVVSPNSLLAQHYLNSQNPSSASLSSALGISPLGHRSGRADTKMVDSSRNAHPSSGDRVMAFGLMDNFAGLVTHPRMLALLLLLTIGMPLIILVGLTVLLLLYRSHRASVNSQQLSRHQAKQMSHGDKATKRSTISEPLQEARMGVTEGRSSGDHILATSKVTTGTDFPGSPAIWEMEGKVAPVGSIDFSMNISSCSTEVAFNANSRINKEGSVSIAPPDEGIHLSNSLFGRIISWFTGSMRTETAGDDLETAKASHYSHMHCNEDSCLNDLRCPSCNHLNEGDSDVYSRAEVSSRLVTEPRKMQIVKNNLQSRCAVGLKSQPTDDKGDYSWK